MSSAVELVGKATGPNIFVKEFGREVPTFLEKPGGKLPALTHHVPLDARGNYKPKELANYDENVQYRVDDYGYVLCGARTKQDRICPKRAVNRVGLCEAHGGRLHPLDKVKKKEAYDESTGIETLSRYQQFLAGQITVDDLDDEELANAAFRANNGRLYRPKNIPADVVKKFHAAIYKRAEDGLRSGVAKAAGTLVEIVENRAVEPADRIKAAQILLDRGLGKAPQQINIGLDTTPFNQIMDKLATVTREESRAARGLTDGYIDAEIVEPQQQPSIEAPQQEQSPFEQTVEKGAMRDRLKERNPAILAQAIEIKTFEYDVRDHREEIRKARNRRYAANAIGHNRFKIELLPHGPGVLKVKFTHPDDIVTPKSVLEKEKRKRKFDGNSFYE